ncbi:MAG: hypothetical protein EZS28_035889 [Streblomastix strix]|uniref:Uncharacterized protein n=1 Tax=Streblomastix strix TaxID=222440 RepID=A0A5J4UEF0_9EUKA|nr:MAG: hypothetical protein EZS28_035889 [Streblomastix strix]
MHWYGQIQLWRRSGLIGGGFYSTQGSGTQLIINGKIIFDNCTSSGYGGGQNLEASGSASVINITGELEFKQCHTSTFGGGLYASIRNKAVIEINNASFINCSANTGGGLNLNLSTNAYFAIYGISSFTDCNCSLFGGGIYIMIDGGTVNFNQSSKVMFVNCRCSLQNGGGMYCSISNFGQMIVNNMKLNNCYSRRDGGGIYASIESEGQLILDKSCEFYQCESHGNGGGIFAIIDSTTQCSFMIKDALIHQCTSLNSTNSSLSYPRSGFGGGLFLGVNGDYSPSTELIDLHGMKIYNNSADKGGQSLYIVMIKIEEFCKYGILGEYVKGNYSDTYSNEQELVGISIDFSTFNDSTSEIIEQQQQPLEFLWRILGILKSAQVVVNISNPNGKLIFHLEGSRMVPGYLNVKIFELRDKTQEEIDQEEQQIKYKHNKNILKSLKRASTQSSIALKYQKGNHKQISINSNLKIKQNTCNYKNEIIYPPEDGLSNPISIEGEIQSEQKATIEMNDGSWLNYKQKVYGIVISNDRNIFTGKEGIDIEVDETAAVQLEIIIEEDDKKEGNGIPIGVIVGIAVGALALVAVFIIIIIVAVFISKKKKAKKVVRAYGPEMRLRNLPMENKFPQNSHSLDAVSKAMESITNSPTLAIEDGKNAVSWVSGVDFLARS